MRCVATPSKVFSGNEEMYAWIGLSRSSLPSSHNLAEENEDYNNY